MHQYQNNDDKNQNQKAHNNGQLSDKRFSSQLVPPHESDVYRNKTDIQTFFCIGIYFIGRIYRLKIFESDHSPLSGIG